MQQKVTHSLFRGGLYLTLAWLFTTLINILAHCVCFETNTWMMLFVLSAVSWICLLPWTARRKLQMHSWGLLSVRTACFLLSYICTFIAIEKNTSLTDVALLNNTAPIFLPFVVWIWLHRKIPARLWGGIVIGFLGVALVLKPTPALLQENGLLYALATGLLYAVSMVALRQLGKKESMLSVLFYFFLFSMLLSLPAALITWRSISWKTLLGLIGLGLFSYLSQICYLKAFTWARPIKINPLNYTGVIFSYLGGWLLWRESLDLLGCVGIALIIAGSCLTFYLDTTSQRS